ncbi:phenolphthiocerol/phthiocerol/phthiodiolone dimycocerosyl transferase [Microdochium nivale]|nr:phenolphthiocerol/phthiocerol/phthiodiolone dimycocerosyl transferase [Microdochium nivale]
MTPSPPVIRPTGSIAMWNTARHSLGLYRCVVNTSRYVIPDHFRTCQSLKPVIQRALARVVQKHGILRAGIADEHTEKPAFVHIRQLDLDQMVQWVKDESPMNGDGGADAIDGIDGLLRATEKQHDQLWEDLDTKPGWKLLVRENRRDGGVPTSLDMSLCFHHAYMDGGSSYIFHQDLLQALNDPEITSSPYAPFSAILQFPVPPQLAAAAEDLIPFKISLRFLVTMLWQEIIWDAVCPSWLRQPTPPERTPWTGRPVNPELHNANLRCIRVSNTSLEALLGACRGQKATLTTLLQGLVAASLAARLPAATTTSCFVSNCPISLNRFARPPYDPKSELHCLVTSTSHRIEPETVVALRRAQQNEAGSGHGDADSIIWSIARESSAALRDKVRQLPQDDKVALMTWISDWRGFLVAKFGKSRNDTFEVSNLGSMSVRQAAATNGSRSGSSDGGGGHDDDSPRRQQQLWCIDRAVFSQGANPIGAAFALNVAGVKDCGVWITVSWQEGTVETSLMEGVVGDVQRWADEFPARGRFY